MAVGRARLAEQGIVDDAQQTGIMVAFYLPPTTANALALTNEQVPEGSEVLAADDLHITLAYLGKIDDQIEPAESLYGLLSELAKRTLPMTGKINGVGKFSANEDHGMEALYANVDAPSLAEFRQDVVKAVTNAGFLVGGEHGFSPHVTLAYVPKQEVVDLDPPTMNVTFDTLHLSWGDRIIAFTLGSGNMNESRQIVDFFARNLSEAAVKPDGPGFLLSGVVIAEGLSANGNYYTEGALKSGIEVFRGKPIYADHPSLTEEQDRPERSVRDLVGRLPSDPNDFWLAKNDADVTVLRFRNARLSKTADWLATMIEEKIAGDMSINAMGSGEEKNRTFHVTEFTDATSLDFVTQAAAGGLGQLVAAQRGGDALKDLTVRTLASARPDLLDAIATRERRKAYGEKQQVTELRLAVEATTKRLVDVTARAEKAEQELRQQQAGAMIDKMLADVNLPPHSQARVRRLIERRVGGFVAGGASPVREAVTTTPTIASAIAAAAPGETIVVQAGTHQASDERAVYEAMCRRLKHERSRVQARGELEALHTARPEEVAETLAEAVAVHMGVCDVEGRTPDWLYQMARQVTREAMLPRDFARQQGHSQETEDDWIAWLKGNLIGEQELREKEEWEELWWEYWRAEDLESTRRAARHRPNHPVRESVQWQQADFGVWLGTFGDYSINIAPGLPNEIGLIISWQGTPRYRNTFFGKDVEYVKQYAEEAVLGGELLGASRTRDEVWTSRRPQAAAHRLRTAQGGVFYYTFHWEDNIVYVEGTDEDSARQVVSDYDRGQRASSWNPGAGYPGARVIGVQPRNAGLSIHPPQLVAVEARRVTLEQEGAPMDLATWAEGKNIPPEQLAAFIASLETPGQARTSEEWDKLYADMEGGPSQAATRLRSPHRRVYARERATHRRLRAGYRAFQGWSPAQVRQEMNRIGSFRGDPMDEKQNPDAPTAREFLAWAERHGGQLDGYIKEDMSDFRVMVDGITISSGADRAFALELENKNPDDFDFEEDTGYLYAFWD